MGEVGVESSSRATSSGRQALRRLARPLIPVSLAFLAAACTTTATDTGNGTAVAAAPVADSSLPREPFDYRTWDAYLGGQESSQYTSLNQITKDNVNQLQVAWTYMAGEGQPPLFNPIVADGKMFVLRSDGK